MTGDDGLNLDEAYRLKTPDDSRAYYERRAATYDQDFAALHGYVMPGVLAGIFRAEGGAGPVLDIGAGTGLVGEALAMDAVDGLDISPDMLEVARTKDCYRALIEADLTGPLDIPDAAYAGFTSAGTFTHGHVGPVCLPELMRIAMPQALFVLAINAEVFDREGFGSAFADLVGDAMIEPVRFQRVRYYERTDHNHADDTGLVAIFRRAGG